MNPAPPLLYVRVAMASTLADRAAVREALNGIRIAVDPSADATLDARIDEYDAYIRQGWGEHPAVADPPDPDFLARRQALIQLVGLWFSRTDTAVERARATAHIKFNDGD